jgi:hypothetical protein
VLLRVVEDGQPVLGIEDERKRPRCIDLETSDRKIQNPMKPAALAVGVFLPRVYESSGGIVQLPPPLDEDAAYAREVELCLKSPERNLVQLLADEPISSGLV